MEHIFKRQLSNQVPSKVRWLAMMFGIFGICCSKEEELSLPPRPHRQWQPCLRLILLEFQVYVLSLPSFHFPLVRLFGLLLLEVRREWTKPDHSLSVNADPSATNDSSVPSIAASAHSGTATKPFPSYCVSSVNHVAVELCSESTYHFLFRLHLFSLPLCNGLSEAWHRTSTGVGDRTGMVLSLVTARSSSCGAMVNREW